MTNIQKNQRLAIILDTPDGKKSILSYVREVYPDRLVLNQPQDWEEYRSYLEEGEEIKTKIFTRAGVLLYTAFILNSPADDNFTLEYNENYAQIVQRRAYTRVPLETFVDCTIEDIDAADFEEEAAAVQNYEFNTVKYSVPLSCEYEKTVIDAETIDIGGGGLKILAKDDLPKEKVITFKINLFDDIIVAQGIIVNNNLPTRQYGIKFTRISDKDKDKIIKTCLRIEGILNRKSD